MMVFLTPQEGFQEICPVWSDLKPYTCHTHTLPHLPVLSVPDSHLTHCSPLLSKGLYLSPCFPFSPQDHCLRNTSIYLLLFFFCFCFFPSLPHIKSRSLSGL